MKFGRFPTDQAAGCILAHKTALPGRVLKKGRVLNASDCAELAASGAATVVAACLEPGDIGEDEAAERLAMAAMGPGLGHDAAFTGRMNLYAAEDGVLVVDAEAITTANRIDPAITFATLANFSKVASGRMVATAKVISFALSGDVVAAAESALRGAVRVAAFKPRRVGLVATRLPHLKVSTMDKTRRVLEERLRPSGSTLVAEIRVPHETGAVAEAMQELLRRGADFLILFGASAVVDRQDVLPAALDLAGGNVAHLGMPVDPGNLLMLGDLGGLPVLGAPGCARSPKENGFDWVLDRLLAGLPVGPEDITAMGVGGLLMEIGTRPQLREIKRDRTSPKIAAIILGAGKSSRMGGPNKLLATLDGKALIRHVAEAACGAGLAQTVLVTGHLADEVGAEVADLDVTLVHNADFADGMSGSIRTGVNALEPDIDAAIVLLGDMPRIGADAIGKLVSAYRDSPSSLIVTATAAGKRGNPVLWDRRYFDALKNLSGDVGARHVIAENAGFVAEVDIGPAARLDLDTPEALQNAGGSLPESRGKSRTSTSGE
ncbi:MAG: molybdopterin-binding/glycosyltransferase family 2 protein [Roseibium sp.]